MHSWQETGIVLDKSLFGENDIILDVFTVNHGRAKGLVKHGRSSKTAGNYQPGNLLAVTWKARLEEHLGTFTAELIKSYSARLLENQLKLDALATALSEVKFTIPEREETAELFQSLESLLVSLNNDNPLTDFVFWEIALLKALGFALNLSQCAITGTTADLAFVSPKTGRAVNKSAAGKWAPYLLSLPKFLTLKPMPATSGAAKSESESTPAAISEILDGLHLTGYFLQKHIFTSGLPAVRARLVSRLQRSVSV